MFHMEHMSIGEQILTAREAWIEKPSERNWRKLKELLNAAKAKDEQEEQSEVVPERRCKDAQAQHQV